MKKVIYISGPMTGIKDFNYPAFLAAQARFEAEGHEVINPAVTGVEDTMHLENPEWHDYMMSAIDRMRRATHIHFLPKWWLSFGAWVEKIVGLKMRLKNA